MSREAMTLALDALEHHTAIKHPQQRHYRDEAIDALRAALDARPIWFGLTTQEILDMVDDHTERVGGLPMLYRDQAAALARNIEARLKDRNAY